MFYNFSERFGNKTLNPRLIDIVQLRRWNYLPSYQVLIPLPLDQQFIIYKWHKSPMGWFKLNTNQSSMKNPSSIRNKGIIRDDSDNQVKEGLSLGPLAEQLACLPKYGLYKVALAQLYRYLGITHLMVELDAQVFVLLLKNQHSPNLLILSIITDCRNMNQAIYSQEVKHIFKESNKCANGFAKIDYSQMADSILYKEPLLIIYNL